MNQNIKNRFVCSNCGGCDHVYRMCPKPIVSCGLITLKLDLSINNIIDLNNEIIRKKIYSGTKEDLNDSEKYAIEYTKFIADIKNEFGERISLMGNLHTTEVMLQGSVQDVLAASKKAIDDAAANGGFILSTGDQCGRDIPYDNIFAMVETASNYGKYKS